MKFYLIFLVLWQYLPQNMGTSQGFDQPISIKVPELPVSPSTTIDLDSFTYEKNGIEWPGLCMTGTHQSPINIISSINTQEERSSYISFDYDLHRDFAEKLEKFTYDGRGLSLKAELGSLIFTHSDGTTEIYKADRIDLHYPAEHTITKDSRTPRYPLELSISHFLVKSSNITTTNARFPVKKSVVSILFETNSRVSQEDAFLSRMGIDHRQRRPDGTFRVISKGESLDSSEKWQGNGRPGLDFAALQALKELLQFDHWVFRYYGSETQPPCSEDVQRFVFAVPRSVNLEQVLFLRTQIRKIRNSTGDDGELTLDTYKFYGNNRKLQWYDDASNGKIYSMRNGVAGIQGLEYAKT